MPIIDLTNLTEPLYASAAGGADFASYVNHSATFYSYLSTDGNLITLLGTGITVDGANIPTGGTITEARIDLGNNDPFTPDVIVTGLNFMATDLDYNSGEAACYTFWGTINDGPTEVLAPADSVRLIGDHHDWTVGSFLASNDILRGGDFVTTRLWGDVFDVTGGTVIGGDDSIFGVFSEAYGDIGFLKDAQAAGGDDLIQATQDMVNPSNTTIVAVGDASYFANAVLFAGSDVIDLSAVSSARGFIYGDVVDGLDNSHSFIIGGNDLITGTNAALGDQIFGDGRTVGDITAVAGNDTIYGGAGDDRIIGDFGSVGAAATITYGDDVIYGGAGNDEIYGNGGADQLFGGANEDELNGGDGNDTLDGGNGADTMYGDAGNDRLYGGNSGDLMFGGDGNDVLEGDSGNDSLLGEQGNDKLRGGDGNDTLRGGANEDRLEGGEDDDLLYGENGRDTLIGNNGDDTLYGGNSNDMLNGDNGNDLLYGGNHNDALNGGRNNDTLDGGTGNDALDGGANEDSLIGGDGNDTLSGGNGGDTLQGGADNDTLNGGNGGDVLTGDGGSDVFVFAGGFGNDTITDFDEFDDLEDIDLSGVASITDYADLLANHMNQVGADVVIDDGAGNTITVENAQIGDMNQADFTF